MKKSNKVGVQLKKYDDFFQATDNTDIYDGESIANIGIDSLIHFQNHPFKLYEGERLKDMVESVRTNGIMMPIIVRLISAEKYEILSGHNRVEAAKSVGLETIPALIRDDLNDEEALLIVTETNLIQRSFADLLHSERAAALSVHHEAVKSQGKRTDLINEIENLFKNSENLSSNADSETCSHIGNKLKSIEKVGQQYGLSKNSVARYLRINNLTEGLKSLVDDNKIPFLAAVELSYISSQVQSDILIVMQNNEKLKIDIKKAEQLREFSENDDLNPQMIEDILSGVAVKKRNRTSLPVQSFKLKGKMLSKYFKPEDKPEDIEAEIIKALDFYRASLGEREK